MSAFSILLCYMYIIYIHIYICMDPWSRLPDQYFSALEVRMNKLKCIALVPNLIAGCIAGNSAGPADFWPWDVSDARKSWENIGFLRFQGVIVCYSVPSGKPTVFELEKNPLIATSTISMGHGFNSKLLVITRGYLSKQTNSVVNQHAHLLDRNRFSSWTYSPKKSNVRDV